MKAVKIIIAMLLCGSVYGQTVTPNPGPYQNINTKYQYTWQKWSGGIWNAGKLIQTDSAQFMGPVYVPMAPAGDSSTLAANTAWVRRWIADSITPGIPGTTTPTWKYFGNYTDAEPTNGRLGFKDSADLHLMTNGVIRATIPAGGIERNGGLANKALMIDTVTKKVYYTDMGSSGSSLDTTNLHGRGVAYYQLEGDSAVLTLNDSSKYSVAIGGVGAEKWVLGEYGLLNDSSTANLYKLRVDSTALVPYSPRPAYHIFGNHTSGAANPTFGKLNVNSIDATGTPSGSNALLGNGTWGNPVASAAGSANDIQFNTSGVLAADTSFKFNKTGVGVVHTKKFASFKLASGTTAQANGDTIVGMFLKPLYNINGKTTVKTYDINIGKNYISLDSLYNYSIGDGSAARPTAGHLTAIGFGAGNGASGATEFSLMFGRYAGFNSSGGNRSVFMGPSAGQSSVNSSFSNIFGNAAGASATAPYSNLFGASAGKRMSASNVNAFGQNTGLGAIGANNSNMFGGDGVTAAGQGATGAYGSNMFGLGAGYEAVNGYYDNLFGRLSGAYTTNVNNSNMFGPNAGFAVKNTTGANMVGRNTGSGASGADYSNFFGYSVGDSTQHKITGANNILIGLNITTPAAASTNTMNIGGVLFGTNFYGTVAGAPSKVAQTNGQIGINVETPNITAALEVKSNTAGVLISRMTTTERTAITSPAEGLMVYDLTLHKLYVYDGTTWQAAW